MRQARTQAFETSEARRGASPAAPFGEGRRAPRAMTPASVLSLQRTAGNRAVRALLARSGRDGASVAEPVAAAAREPGVAVDQAVRRKVESATGASLAGVEVHTGAASHEAATAMSARAYTVGDHIHFARDAYRPRTPDGERLIAHELVHAAQGRRAGGTAAQAKSTISRPHDAAEVEADELAAAVVAGRGGHPVRETPAHVSCGGAQSRAAAPAPKPAPSREEREADIGKRADELIAKTAIYTHIMGAIFDGKFAEGHVHLHPREEFLQCFVAHMKAGPDPSEASDDALMAMGQQVAGYNDGDEIHLSAEWADVPLLRDLVPIHEMIHSYEKDHAFKARFGHSAMEGATEYFAQYVCITTGVKFIDNVSYKVECEAISGVADLVGDELLRRAYFRGEVDALAAAIDARKGPDTARRWGALMMMREIDQASTLIDCEPGSDEFQEVIAWLQAKAAAAAAPPAVT